MSIMYANFWQGVGWCNIGSKIFHNLNYLFNISLSIWLLLNLSSFLLFVGLVELRLAYINWSVWLRINSAHKKDIEDICISWNGVLYKLLIVIPKSHFELLLIELNYITKFFSTHHFLVLIIQIWKLLKQLSPYFHHVLSDLRPLLWINAKKEAVL